MSTVVLPRPLGRYTLLRRLATGGMAEIYLAKVGGAGGFEKLVAIKRVHPVRVATGSPAASLISCRKRSLLIADARCGGRTFTATIRS